MSVKLRLRRMGRKKAPVYALVAADARSPRDGRYIEDLGRYEPLGEVTRVTLNEDRVLYWLRQGAQPSETANSLLHKEGFLLRLHLERKGKDAADITQALEEFRARRAGAASTVATAAERRREALEVERKAAAEAAKEAAAKRQAREAELEAQRQAGDDAERAARVGPTAEASEDVEAVAESAEVEVAPAEGEAAEAGVEEPVAEVEPQEAPAAEAEVAESEVAEAEVAEETVAEAEVAEAPVAEAEVAEADGAEAEVAEEPVAEAEVAEEPVAEAEVAEAEVAEEPVAEADVDEPIEEAAADKLERLHGVGKKFAEALRGAGITTFAAVAESSVETLRGAIAAGSEASDAVANEETWSEQARLLAAGDDAAFDAYVAELKKA